MEIFKLFGSILIDNEKANQSIADTEKKGNNLGKSIQNLGKGVTNAGKTMSTWVTGPIAAAGTGLLAMVKTTADAGDAIQKMALRTGFSTEALSEYKHAAELSGSSIETVEKGVRRMQQTLLDAEQGMSSATDSFDALGLSVEDFQGLSPEQQFDKLAMSIASVEDPSRRAALAQEVFGRAGTELLPMLSSGADGIAAMRQEARDLGIVFDQEAADAAAQFNDDMDRLQKSFAGAFQELAKQLLPVLVDDLLPALKENIIPAVKEFADRVVSLIKWFTELDPKWQKIILGAVGLAAAIGPVLMVLGPLIAGIGALISPIGLVVAAIAALIAIGVLLWQNWDEIREKAKEIWDAVAKFFSDLWKGIQNDTTKAWDAIKRFFQGTWDGIKRAVETIWNGISSFLSTRWNNIKSNAMSVWDGIKRAILSPIESARDTIRRIIDQIKSFFSSMRLRIPKIELPPLPHFNLEGSFSLNPPRVPRLDVDWYATGGVFDERAVIGNAGFGDVAEAIVPFEGPHAQRIAKLIADEMPNVAGVGGIEITLPVYLDGREIARNNVKYNAEELERFSRTRNRSLGVQT